MHELRVKIGGRERLGDVSLSVPEKEDAWVEFVVKTWQVRLHLIFEDTEDPISNQSWTLKGKEDHAELTFLNWKFPAGMGLDGLVELVQFDGKKITMSIYGGYVPGFRIVNINFFLEPVDG